MGSNPTALLGKLEHRSGPVVVLNAPPEFEKLLNDWRAEGLPVGQRRTPGSRFVLVFVRSRSDIERNAGSIVTSVVDDALLWIAYPRADSERFRTDITADGGWQVLKRMGYSAVREVHLNDDWTAQRFRRTAP